MFQPQAKEVDMWLNSEEFKDFGWQQVIREARYSQPLQRVNTTKPFLVHRLLLACGEALIALGLRLKKSSEVYTEQEIMPVLWKDYMEGSYLRK
jgi:hypothetical protein